MFPRLFDTENEAIVTLMHTSIKRDAELIEAGNEMIGQYREEYGALRTSPQPARYAPIVRLH